MVGLLTPAIARAQVAPDLAAAKSYAVLGGSAVTNTGTTVVTGDLGVSPGGAPTGFPPGTVTGVIHSADASAAAAQSAVTTAYNNLAGQATTSDLTGVDLGGLVLPAGVYNFSSSAQLTGTLTLDAAGNSNAVFIFKIGSTLTTASGARVVIINSGSSCNVFWQVGSSATLGTSTTFLGNVLALTSITLNTSASVIGRMLARNGAVTLDTNTVNASACTGAAACPVITLSPATLPSGRVGVAYSQTITASGGTAPYTFAVQSGALPAGLSLSTGGVLSGTPTTAGSSTATISATDGVSCPGNTVYTTLIAGAGCPVITISPATLPSGLVGAAYSQTLTSSGGTAPYTYSVLSGTLPAGLSLSTAGVVSGTPTTVASSTVVIQSTDGNGCPDTVTYTIAVTSSVPTLPEVFAIALALGLIAAGVIALRKRRVATR